MPVKQQMEKGSAPKKAIHTKQRTQQKLVSKQNLKKSVSLSESDLELSEISDVSEEEKYFRVERSPEPIAVPDRGTKRPGTGKRRKDREEELNSGEFEEIMPGPPSMRYIKERIGRKLHEVDQQMASYRRGSPNWRSSVDDIRRPPETRRQQTTVGIQVDEGKRPSQVKSVGFFQSGLADPIGANVLKVSSSCQTDQASARPAPARRNLLTSGVQTEKESFDSDHMPSHAPVLPPDIFLNLQMPKADQETQVGVDMVEISRRHPPEAAVDYDQTVTDLPVSIRGRQLGVDVGNERGGSPPHAPKMPETVRGRQFLSVADIDHDQWLEVQNTPMTSADGVGEEKQQSGRTDSVNAETPLTPRTGRNCLYKLSLN